MKNRIIALPLTILTIIICVPATLAFTDILKNLTINSRIELGFFIGFAVYLVIHIVFYKPVFIHVMAHELTHIFWAFLFGGKAKKLEVSASGGRVLINRTNFVITLAPYFFPLYTFIFLAVYIIAKEQLDCLLDRYPNSRVYTISLPHDEGEENIDYMFVISKP